MFPKLSRGIFSRYIYPVNSPLIFSTDSNFINSPLMEKFNRHQLCHLTAGGNEKHYQQYIRYGYNAYNQFDGWNGDSFFTWNDDRPNSLRTSPTTAIAYQIAIMLGIPGAVALSVILMLQFSYRTFFNKEDQLF
jgi:hypothetical protein